MSANASLADNMVAAALVAASLTVLFSLWQPDIDEGLRVKPSDDAVNNRARFLKVRHALLARSLPLAAAWVALLAILMHRSLPILSTLGCGFGCRIDDVAALYLLNTAVVGGLSLATLVKGVRLVHLLRKLSD